LLAACVSCTVLALAAVPEKINGFDPQDLADSVC